jgi:hypothetical protein
LSLVAPERPRPVGDPLRLFDDVPARRAVGDPLPRPAGDRPAAPGGGRLTLEQRLDRVWEGLLAAGSAACPMCRGVMERGADGGATCRGCGSRVE